MIVSSATIENFDSERSKEIIGGLTRLFAGLEHNPPPGFIQSLLLREKWGDALMLTMWESDAALGDFMTTDAGQKLAKGFGALIGEKAELKNYFVTWQTDAQDIRTRPCGCGPAKDGKDQK